MAFSVLCAIPSYILLLTTCSCVLAATKSWNEYAGPYMLVRLKRSPNRAFTFSGFNPNSGLAAFATSADYVPYYQYQPAIGGQVAYPSVESRGETFAPSPSVLSAEYKPPTSDYKPPNGDSQPTPEYTSLSVLDEERKSSAPAFTPPSEQTPGVSYESAPRKAKKKPTYGGDDDDEDEVGNSGKSRSSSSASFNAWFPIVLGMYPSASSGGRSANGNGGESLKEAAAGSGSGSGSSSSSSSSSNGNGGSKEHREPGAAGGLGTTVIANSVSHGKSSVASSHAIAYGGDAPPRAQPYRTKG